MKKKGVVFLAAALGLIMLGSFGPISAGPKLQSANVQSSETNVLAEKQFAEAVTLLRQENFAEAIAAYKKVIQLLPASPIAQDARYWIGQTYLRMEKYDEALAVFKKLLKDHPASPIVPVTQLMISRAEQEIEAEKTRAKRVAASEPLLIVDPATGAEFRRIHSFSGKSDVLLGLGGFFSPNGKFLLSEKTVIPMDGSEPFLLTDKEAWRGTWSPDGKKAAFYAENAIWVVPVSPETGRPSGPAKKALDGKYVFQYPVTWSPDSRKIALPRRDDTTDGDIWVLSLEEGALTRLTDEPWYETNAFWLADGKSMVYLTRGQRFEIRLLSGPGEKPKTLVEMEVGELFPPSPNGRWVAYKNRQTLCLYSLADQRIFRITPPEGVGTFHSWSRDGERLIFRRSSYEWKSLLRIGSTSGGPTFELARGIDLWPYQQTWSSESDRIITHRANDNQLVMIPLSSGDTLPVDLGAATGEEARPLSFSPDHRRLAFAVGREDDKEDLFTIPVALDEPKATGPPALVFKDWDRRQVFMQMSWSPDSARIALIHKGDLWLTSAGEEKRVQLTKTPEIEGGPKWSPQGDRIVFNSEIREGDTRLKVISASGGEATILMSPSGRHCWSPDGKAVTAASGKKLLNVPIDGGKPKEILDISNKGYTERSWDLTWLPDGKRIAFMAEPEKARGTSSLICIASLETGEIVELASDDTGWKDGFFLSPDGKWISYYTDQFIKIRPASTIWEVKLADLVKEKK
jgi:Tol biopolymer transport system component